MVLSEGSNTKNPANIWSRPQTRAEKRIRLASMVGCAAAGIAVGALALPNFTEPANMTEVRASIIPCYAEYREEPRAVKEFPEQCIPLLQYTPYTALIEHPQPSDNDAYLPEVVDSYILAPKDQLPSEEDVIFSTQALINRQNTINRKFDALFGFMGGTFGASVGLLVSRGVIAARRWRKQSAEQNIQAVTQ